MFLFPVEFSEAVKYRRIIPLAAMRIVIYVIDLVYLPVFRRTNGHYVLSKHFRSKYIGNQADYVSRDNGVCGMRKIFES